MNMSSYEEENYAKSLNAAEKIAQKYGLSLRGVPKDYGTIGSVEVYSDRYMDWRELSEEFLMTSHQKHNPLYSLWNGIKSRCYNENSISYSYYGGAGIRMSLEWKDNYDIFARDILSDIGKKPLPYYSIDRINGLGNYMRGNVRWSPPLRQNRNKINNVKINEYNGLILATLYKYYTVTGAALKTIFNTDIAETDEQKITGSWACIYNACKSYCPYV